MNPDLRPVIVAAAQTIEKEKNPLASSSPLEIMVKASRNALSENQLPESLLSKIDTIGMVNIMGWEPDDCAQQLADQLGCTPKSELVKPLGGETPLALINELVEKILSGESSIVLATGCNNIYTLKNAIKQGVKLDWPVGAAANPNMEELEFDGNSEREMAYGMRIPIELYPMMENAYRHRKGLSFEAHKQKMGELFTSFTEVAADNPYAWFPVKRSVEELTTVTQKNRMIGFPYPKYLNSVIDTDQGAALLLMSAGEARRQGIPEDQWVYWWGGAFATEDPWFYTERKVLSESPAMAACAEKTFKMTGITMDQVDYVDFYSCFPIAVEVACESYGIAEDDPRGLTVTGGLPYAGGPANNYPMHAVAAMYQKLKANPGKIGLTTGNGWYLTKHSSCVWSSQPGGLVDMNPEATQPLSGAVEFVENPTGKGVIETYTIMHNQKGEPEKGLVIGKQDGKRFLAHLPNDAETLLKYESIEGIGVTGTITQVDGLNRFTPD